MISSTFNSCLIGYPRETQRVSLACYFMQKLQAGLASCHHLEHSDRNHSKRNKSVMPGHM